MGRAFLDGGIKRVFLEPGVKREAQARDWALIQIWQSRTFGKRHGFQTQPLFGGGDARRFDEGAEADRRLAVEWV